MGSEASPPVPGCPLPSYDLSWHLCRLSPVLGAWFVSRKAQVLNLYFIFTSAAAILCDNGFPLLILQESWAVGRAECC